MTDYLQEKRITFGIWKQTYADKKTAFDLEHVESRWASKQRLCAYPTVISLTFDGKCLKYRSCANLPLAPTNLGLPHTDRANALQIGISHAGRRLCKTLLFYQFLSVYEYYCIRLSASAFASQSWLRISTYITFKLQLFRVVSFAVFFLGGGDLDLFA